MMIDRINALFTSLHLPTVDPYTYPSHSQHTSMTPHHDHLDVLDRHLGIITRFRIDGSLAPVGERVRRLERHKMLTTNPPFFWLGAQTESLVLTG